MHGWPSRAREQVLQIGRSPSHFYTARETNGMRWGRMKGIDDGPFSCPCGDEWERGSGGGRRSGKSGVRTCRRDRPFPWPKRSSCRGSLALLGTHSPARASQWNTGHTWGDGRRISHRISGEPVNPRDYGGRLDAITHNFPLTTGWGSAREMGREERSGLTDMACRSCVPGRGGRGRPWGKGGPGQTGGMRAWAGRQTSHCLKPGEWAPDGGPDGFCKLFFSRWILNFFIPPDKSPRSGGQRLRDGKRRSGFDHPTHPMTITHRKRLPQPPEEIQSPSLPFPFPAHFHP